MFEGEGYVEAQLQTEAYEGKVALHIRKRDDEAGYPAASLYVPVVEAVRAAAVQAPATRTIRTAPVAVVEAAAVSSAALPVPAATADRFQERLPLAVVLAAPPVLMAPQGAPATEAPGVPAAIPVLVAAAAAVAGPQSVTAAPPRAALAAKAASTGGTDGLVGGPGGGGAGAPELGDRLRQ